MKSSGQQSKPRSNYALFLGDLSIFCAEKDIEEAFSPYGEIVNVRIQRNKETSRALSYGFIEFSCETAAVSAMNEMNGFVLKGRPLRIRWAAKRNQPVKSENTALHTAATIFVKFASSTGIIVSEELLREHFSVYGKILDTTIRTITIDEAFNRSKGYGFVNFVNDDEVDGLAAAYHASSELQNATVNGVNYRCEVGYKHQPQQQSQQSSVTSAPQHHHQQQQPQQQQMFARSDSDSMSGYSAGNMSTSMSAASRTGAGFLPSLSPKHALQQHSSSSLASGGSHSPVPSHSHSFVPTGPSSPLPGYYQVTMPNISSGASVHSVGSNSTGGVFSQGSPYPSSVHSPVPVSAIVSYMPASSGGSVHSGQMYPQVQGSGYPIVGVPANQHFFPAQPAHHQQQQQPYMQHQPQYYAAPQQQQHHQQGYYGNGAPYQHAPMAGPYYGAAQQPDQYGYYAHQQQPMQQQGYYAPSGQSVPMVPPPSNMGHRAHPPQASTYEATPAGPQLTEQMLSQHKQGSRTRRPSMGPQPTGPYYNSHPQMFTQTYQAQHPYGPEGGVAPEGRRSQRNISNKSNISEITSATLNELQDDEEDEEVHDEEVQSPLPTIDENAAVVQSAADDDAVTNEIAQNMSCHLKSTLQTLAPSAPVINCKLSTRRNQRNSTGGSNTTEITAQVLYDLQMQEQRLEKEEEEEGCTEPPNQRCNTPVESALRTSVTQSVASEVHLEKDCNTKTAPNSAVKQVSSTPEPAAIASRAKSISPFTLSAATLAQLQSDCEVADSANNRDKLFQRRSKRNISDRSNASDITAALAFMQIDASNPDYFRSLDDDGESYHSSAEASAVCVCGKALRSTASPSCGPVATCPFGTTACSCVYSATC